VLTFDTAGALSTHAVAPLACKQNCVVRVAYLETLYRLDRHQDCGREAAVVKQLDLQEDVRALVEAFHAMSRQVSLLCLRCT
jgi:hypothetical protein